MKTITQLSLLSSIFKHFNVYQRAGGNLWLRNCYLHCWFRSDKKIQPANLRYTVINGQQENIWLIAHKIKNLQGESMYCWSLCKHWLLSKKQ